MTARTAHITNRVTVPQFSGFSVPDAALLPAEFWVILPHLRTMAELKVTLTALQLSFTLGAPDAALSISDLAHLAGLDRKAVRRGLALGQARGTLLRVKL